MAISLKDLRAHLAELVNSDDLLQRELADRYLMLTGSIRRLDKQIRKDGESVEVINGGQRYIKAHPLISDRARLNRELLAIEKQLGLQTAAARKEREKQKAREQNREAHRKHQQDLAELRQQTKDQVENAREQERKRAEKKVKALEKKLAAAEEALKAEKQKQRAKVQPEPEKRERSPLI